jgi:hypothetical protein
MLKNSPSVKPEEMQWFDLESRLREHMGPVTKAELSDYSVAAISDRLGFYPGEAEKVTTEPRLGLAIPEVTTNDLQRATLAKGVSPSGEAGHGARQYGFRLRYSVRFCLLAILAKYFRFKVR